MLDQRRLTIGQRVLSLQEARLEIGILEAGPEARARAKQQLLQTEREVLWRLRWMRARRAPRALLTRALAQLPGGQTGAAR